MSQDIVDLLMNKKMNDEIFEKKLYIIFRGSYHSKMIFVLFLGNKKLDINILYLHCNIGARNGCHIDHSIEIDSEGQ